MLRPEDAVAVGLVALPGVRRPSAVSQVLKTLREDLPGKPWDLAEGVEDGLSGWRILVASDQATRRRAYALAQRIYAGCGYANEGDWDMDLSVRGADPRTLTLLVEDASGREAATVSLVYDTVSGLPCDEIYASELTFLRGQGRRLVEVTRLAVADEHARSRMLLVRMFNFIYIHARRVQGFDDFVIEVNPRHVAYYIRLLKFELAAPERPCPRVNGAPAVLLRLDLGVSEKEIRRVGGMGAAARERTLYPYFFSWLHEGAVAEFLAR